ncbi:MAG: hypothetical protein ACI9SB_002935 [Candidatus Azotimanducaceae bacterium]|jgi:hypothetical protein
MVGIISVAIEIMAKDTGLSIPTIEDSLERLKAIR